MDDGDGVGEMEAKTEGAEERVGDPVGDGVGDRTRRFFGGEAAVGVENRVGDAEGDAARERTRFFLVGEPGLVVVVGGRGDDESEHSSVSSGSERGKYS